MFPNLQKKALYSILILALLGCSKNNVPTVNLFSGENPWFQIRKERISDLLPRAMEKADVDVWMVLCRENNNDPIAFHIGGENASRPAMFVFSRKPIFTSIVFSPPGEASALIDLGIHDSVVVLGRGESAVDRAAQYVSEIDPASIALNTSQMNALADGLSYSQYMRIQKSLGKLHRKTVSSDELIYQWLSVKLPREVEIMRMAAEITAQWEEDAYRTIIPGKTTDADVAKFLKRKMSEFSVEDAWAADQNPNVNSGPDRGHSHSTEKVIQYGDVVQTDFGIKVFGIWVTDIQRFAYVLREGEDRAPRNIQKYWEVARDGSKLVKENMKPGIKGFEVDSIQRVWMKENGSLPVMWSTGHPVGYVAHDIGPALGGGDLPEKANRFQKRALQVGNVFAYDGFYSWNIDGGTKTISVEEMVVVTENGADYLTAPQQELILVGNR